MNFDDFRNTQKEFIYKKYEIIDEVQSIKLKFYFEIKGIASFEPEIEIPKVGIILKNLYSNYAKNLVFNIGMVELLSYWKCVCPPNIVIECGYLNMEQVEWFKKLYYYGLGEFRYKNNINVQYNDFVSILSTGETIKNELLERELRGYLIPIGGGKDSAVTLELLNNEKQDNLCITVGGKEPSIQTAKIAGYEDKQIIQIKRKIAPELLELNSKGYLNGHTPFSALLAFLTYFVAFLTNKKHIVLSNESSANESNINGEKINHQYSKTYEFENDFRWYASNYLRADINYFSLLRPINELEIAMLFAKEKQYHKIFKSCNIGSKQEPWKWCCNCPKCLFVYIILSPFLYKDDLLTIFGEDLFEKECLKLTFIELCGYGQKKPFECVGTYEEVNYAICQTIQKLEDQELPMLLKYYKQHYGLRKFELDLTKYYNEQNNVPKELQSKLKKEVNL